MGEVRPIVHVTRSAAIIRTISGQFSRGYSEPASWSVVLDNSTGLYNPSSDIADVRANEDVYCNINVAKSPDSPWASPDLIVEDYDYDTLKATVSGRCRLAELDRDDQVIEVADGIATAINMSLSDVVGLILAPYGLTITGLPSRTVREYNLIGNPLNMLRELLDPTHVFYMGSGGQIVVVASTTHTSAGTLTDVDDLEVLSFRRTTEIRNKATVERLVPQNQYEVLFDQARSGGGELGPTQNGPHAITPSRLFQFTILEGYRGVIEGIVLYDEDDEIVGASPFLLSSYVGTTAVHSFGFVYTEGVDASTWGEWIPNWRIQIQGVPADVDPVPESGYSETYSTGAGNRPYPEPFSSVTINTGAEALAAATALVEQGTRIGNIVNLSTRLRPSKIFLPNAGLAIVDEHSGLDETMVIESVGVSWDENGDSGTITYECTIPEVA